MTGPSGRVVLAMGMVEIGRVILVVGIVLVIVGGISALGVRLPFGRLPGDIVIEGERGGFHFPIRR